MNEDKKDDKGRKGVRQGNSVCQPSDICSGASAVFKGSGRCKSGNLPAGRFLDYGTVVIGYGGRDERSLPFF